MAGKNPITVLTEAEKGLDDVNAKLKVTIDNILKINDAALKTPKNLFPSSPKELNGELVKNKELINTLNVELEKQRKLQKSLQEQITRVSNARKQSNQKTTEEIENQKILSRNAREAAKLSSNLSTSYEKEALKLVKLRRAYKDVALTQGESSKSAKKLRTEITNLDNRLKKVDANVGQFQRSVGNYGKAMGSAVGAARNLAGAMGAVGGAFLVANVIKDAFNRVREFDKSMQNLAGVLRTTRSELKPVEKEIINVAGASVKTSREVAGLAESLATLGKSPEQIVKLLKPVNDLSIGLEATSEEAGEFLVQMLNAFGAADSEAGKYADTIATIRMSTTLDFQKMRDSLPYLAPISKILNKDLAYTGSVVGILADNSLKAESAGRLLATAQQRLAKDDKSLIDGLNEINKARAEGKTELEVLAVANKLFGAEAAKVGVILANNTELIEKNAQAIRDNGGALDDLVKKQLESVDAKLKILDSTWEKMILSFEKGDGVLSNSFKNIIGFINGALEGITRFNQTQEESNNSSTESARINSLKEQRLLYEELGDSAKRVALERADRARDEVDNITEEIRLLKEKNKGLKADNAIEGYNAGSIAKNNAELEKLSTRLGVYQGVLEASEEIIIEESGAREDNTEKIESNTDATDKNTESKKKSIEAVVGSIAYYNALISKLEEKRNKLATTATAWNNYTLIIDEAKQSLANLKIEFEGLNFEGNAGSIEESYKRIKELLTEPQKLEGFDYDAANTEIDNYFDNLRDRKERELELEAGFVESKKQLLTELTYASVDLVNTLFDRKAQAYEDDINRNNSYYSSLLNNERLSERQRSAIEAERDAKNIELEKKRREEEKKALIFNKVVAVAQIGINTAKTVAAITLAAAELSAVTFGVGGVAFAAVQIPLAIASGAAQVAAVLATPVPQYKTGKKKGEGKNSIALLNDGGKDELRISESGEMERITGRNVLGYVKKSDTIIPDADKYLSNLSDKELYNNVHKHAILSSISHQNDALNNYMVKSAIDKQTDRLIKAYKESKPKIHLHNNNVNNIDLAFIKRGLDIL